MNSIIFQFLNEPRRIRTRLEDIDRKIEELKASMLPGAIRYDKDSVMFSPDDPMIRYVERLSPLERRKSILEKEYGVALREFEKALGCLTDRQKAVIRMKYLDGMSNKGISEALGIRRRNVLKLCERAYELLLERLLTDTTGMCYDVI